MVDIVIKIPSKFESFLETAILRFQYLYPELEVTLSGLQVNIKNTKTHSLHSLKKELLHLIYKEKIYSETLDIRTAIYRGISDE